RFPALHALTAGATLLALLFFLCAVFLSGTVSTTDAQTDEAALFTEGYQAYLKGDTDKAIAVLTSVLKQYPNGKVNDLALYWLGKSYQKAGRTQGAIAAFRELKAKYPRSSMYGHTLRQLAALEKALAGKRPTLLKPRRPESGWLTCEPAQSQLQGSRAAGFRRWRRHVPRWQRHRPARPSSSSWSG